MAEERHLGLCYGSVAVRDFRSVVVMVLAQLAVVRMLVTLVQRPTHFVQVALRVRKAIRVLQLVSNLVLSLEHLGMVGSWHLRRFLLMRLRDTLRIARWACLRLRSALLLLVFLLVVVVAALMDGRARVVTLRRRSLKLVHFMAARWLLG